MRDADAFDDTPFLGLARHSRRDPYRLGLFAQHLEPGETPLALLAIHGGTLVVTDRRLLEFRAHLEVHGAWNVREFQGYEVRRSVPRASAAALEHRVTPDSGNVLDAVVLRTEHGEEAFLVSRGPEPTLSPEEFEVLRAAVLGPQPK